MKNYFTQISLLRSIVLILSFCLPLMTFCQPDYDFRNAVLVSGTSNQTGAVYLFQNVKTGVDAKLTIKDITGGITLDTIDGGSGYVEALQPVLEVPPFANGYVEFDIDFLVAGTNTPMIQAEVPATPIDVDGANTGDGAVNEFDMLQLTNGYVNYDMLGGELSMNITNPWVHGANIATIDYPGVDTTPRQVMFTVVNAGISTFTFRSGANSVSATNHMRLRSVYFKKFLYPNSFLPVHSLSFFSGVSSNGKVALEWKMLPANSIQKTVVERSDEHGQFTAIGEVLMSTGTNTVTNYIFTDNTLLQGVAYYRLKMTGTNGQVQYSNVLLFRADNTQKQSFKIYPSIINDKITVNIISEKNEETSLLLFNMNGHNVYKKKIMLRQGNNSITLYGFSNLLHGTYVATVQTNNTINSQQIMIQ